MIRVGLIGFGLGGRVFHAPLISSVEGLELAAVLERNLEQGRRALPRHHYLPVARRDAGRRLARSLRRHHPQRNPLRCSQPDPPRRPQCNRRQADGRYLSPDRRVDRPRRGQKSSACAVSQSPLGFRTFKPFKNCCAKALWAGSCLSSRALTAASHSADGSPLERRSRPRRRPVAGFGFPPDRSGPGAIRQAGGSRRGGPARTRRQGS